ncbi:MULTISPECIES: 7-carboxy-7-deazaguanine synthase QueE [Carboxydocella]|uniref:7-carboxy-7-deazaguanine synthase n=2 Tax=Carboxydocella TaxID=178898 RepID=A0A1T4LNU8_9FIRM|nr:MULTISPECIES: 7-carboxy-7-deazaguanine synthase QueE [Carboxydocella]AVX20542.1 Organic radical activating enzyme [Carboxydocella thermautotrophica]GAW31468.1 hypothetical protein JDF658_12330 [Carboxydocella sp. JDF658]SJZ56400.1 Organic radical activating enzyme [Carboxydocella sporoproducens DSM 16521]
MQAAFLIEMMSSFQGEGTVVGLRQLFLRFAGCNLACAYCDTRYSLHAQETWKVEFPPGTGCWNILTNPVTVEQLLEQIKKFNPDKHHSLSLTGGEPLLHSDFLQEFLPKIKQMGWKIYLETNGTLVHNLKQVLDYIDIIAMDIKLESATGAPTPWEEHQKFLELAMNKSCFIKVVVNSRTDRREIGQVAQLGPERTIAIDIVLQPQTGSELPPANRWIEWQEILKPFYREVRIIPQTHKILGVL